MTGNRTPGRQRSSTAGAGKNPDGEPIGPLLIRLRTGRGLTQSQVAERLCGLSGRPTVSRHEVSRWERQERMPGPHWRGWLAAVLDAPLEQLEAAMARTRPTVDPAAIPGIQRAVDRPQLWQVPTAAQLLAALDLGKVDVRGLAHAWLTGPLEPPNLQPGRIAHRVPHPGGGNEQDRVGKLESRLRVLRRQDDLAGGRRLATVVDRELRWAVAALRRAGGGEERRRTLRLIAGYAQLAGWVRADAGQGEPARRAYRVALQTAAVAGDRDLAAYVLGSLSHLSLAENADEALLLARSGHTGVRNGGSPLTRALLLHRVASAAARVHERRTADTALAEAQRLAEQSVPEWEPAWLYWLNQGELAAMTGRCLAALGRPLRAARLLSRRRPDAGARTAALDGVWLARSYVALGEVDEACRVAGRALADAAASGSARAAAAVRHLHPLLLRHGRVAAVREYERQVALLSR